MPLVSALDAGTEVVAPGRRVALELLARDASPGPYASVVDHVTPEIVHVLSPMSRLQTVTVPLGAPVRVGLRLERRFYTFDSVVVEHVFHPQALLGLSAPVALARRDQRAYFRLPLVLQPELAAVLHGDGRTLATLHATIVNLSGGGAELVSPQPVETGAVLALKFWLDGRRLEMAAQAAHVTPPPADRFNYRVHCQFLNLDRRGREEIVRYVFRRQIALLRSGVAPEPEMVS